MSILEIKKKNLITDKKQNAAFDPLYTRHKYTIEGRTFYYFQMLLLSKIVVWGKQHMNNSNITSKAPLIFSFSKKKYKIMCKNTVNLWKRNNHAKGKTTVCTSNESIIFR